MLACFTSSNFEIQFLHSMFGNLGYPKYLVEQVFSANNKKLYIYPPPLEAEEPSNILVLLYNNSLKQFQRIIKSFPNTKFVFKYSNTIACSLIKNSPAPLEAEGSVYSVPCL